ncbi:unnamed protein product, partial [Staurois parvus]
VLCVFYCVCCVCVLLGRHPVLVCNTKQHAEADRGEICIVYIQTSPQSVILGDHRVPAGHLYPGPRD